MTNHNSNDIAHVLGIPATYRSRRSVVRRAAAGIAAGAALAVTVNPLRSSASTITEGVSNMSQSILYRSTTPVIVTPTPTTGPAPIDVPPGVGDVMDFTPTEQFTWKTTGDTTNGAVDTFEAALQPGYPGAPEHIHDANGEIFYVLDGVFRFKIGDEMIHAPAGTFAFVPRGTAHTWVNIDDGVSRLLTQFLPGGMRGFVDATAELMQAVPPDPAALEAVADQFHTTVVGPPLQP